MNFKESFNNFLSNKYLALTVTFVILLLCTLPSSKIELPGDLTDKDAHFIAFGGWAFCWQAAYRKYLLTLLLGVLYGIGIEFWQDILPDVFNRNFDWYDALADSIGVVIGLILWKIKTLLNI